MLTSFVYQKNKVLKNVTRQELAKALWDKEAFVWVDLEDPSEFESETLVELFNFHPLAIEDCLIDHSEPKIDSYDDYTFLVVHAVNMESKEELQTYELNLFANKHYVVSFHKDPIRSIALMRDLESRKSGALISEGTDMLVHGILDQLVDAYLPVVSEYERRVDEIEDQIFGGGRKDFFPKILKVQKDVLYLKRIIGPQRETIRQLSKDTHSFVRPENMIYYRDIYDHLFRFYQMAEEVHGLINGILQVYYSHTSNEMNQVVKTMTVIATVALPMMVISGIYGMNFQNIPELDWSFGYLYVIGLMVLVSVSLLGWMKFKRWL